MRFLSRFFSITLLLFVGSGLGFGQTAADESGDAPGDAPDDGPATERKIIYLDEYEPIPGDLYTLTVSYLAGQGGASGGAYPLVLQADMSFDLPLVGRLSVSGLNYEQLRERVLDVVRPAVPADYVNFVFSSPAIFDVQISGYVGSPGIVETNSLRRVSDLVSAAGGFTAGSSRRRIELSRNGETRTLDITRYFQAGERRENPLLRPGDRLFVPLREASVTIGDAVVSPGTYEILAGETLGDVLPLAGGLVPTAQLSDISLLRLNDDNTYVQSEIEVDDPRELRLRGGDRISIPSSLNTRERILVEGALFGQPLRGETPTSIPTTPIRFHIPFRPGLSLLDVLEQVGGPTPYAETERSYVRRAETGERVPLPDLLDIWDSQDATRDVLLNPDDRIIVPIMRLEVAVAGQVNSPTTVPFQEGQTVGDYVTLAGGVNAEDGSVNRIFFLDVRGRRTPTNFDSIVPPGSTIFVGRNAWAQTRQTVGNVLIVTGWISTIATFLSQVFGISVADLISQ